MSEFKKSDFVTGAWGVEKRVFKIDLKPKLKSNVLYLTLNIDGKRRDCLAQWFRHATPEEIKLGYRIN